MRWQIAHYIFCDQQQTLTTTNQSQQLEPMMVEVLRYFCQHHDEIISINTLVEQVWLNRFVSDNTVTKLITKLRKAFADDAKKPRFIATFPKKGYKFIAAVELLSAQSANEYQQQAPSTHRQIPVKNGASTLHDLTTEYSVKHHLTSSTVGIQSKKSRVWFNRSNVVWGMLLIIICTTWLFGLQGPASHQVFKTAAKALTREAGSEMNISMSPDGRYLSYMQRDENNMLSLWIKSLEQQTAVEMRHAGASSFAGPLAWNDAGDQVVYLLTTSDSCQYFTRPFDGLTLHPPELLLTCPSGSYGKIAFLHDDHRFVYAASMGPDSAYFLYEFNQQTGQSRLLPQPEAVLGGNSLFDVHPSHNTILISSPDKQQWEGFYSLNLDNDELRLLFKQDAYTCCGIWDHTGTRVVLMGEHPAYQLLSYDKTGNQPEVIYSGSQQLWRPERHANGQDYLFIAGKADHNILRFTLADSSVLSIVNSSVDDRLAVYSAPQKRIAFVSFASGNEEIWLVNADGSARKKLTQFNDSRHYLDLLWSPDGSFLVAVTLNEIHKIEPLSGTTIKLKLPQVERRGVSVKDPQTIAFSQFIDQHWQLMYFDLQHGALSFADKKWQYAHFTANPDDSLWQDQSNHLYVGLEQKELTDADMTQQPLLNGRTFNLQKYHDHWFWLHYNQGRYQLMIKPLGGVAEILLNADSSHVDLSEIGVLYQQAVNNDADVYTTLSFLP